MNADPTKLDYVAQCEIFYTLPYAGNQVDDGAPDHYGMQTSEFTDNDGYTWRFQHDDRWDNVDLETVYAPGMTHKKATFLKRLEEAGPKSSKRIRAALRKLGHRGGTTKGS